MNSTARFPAQWNGKFLLWMEQRFRLCQELALKQIQQLRMQENLPFLITLEKICTALGVTLSQFFVFERKNGNVFLVYSRAL